MREEQSPPELERTSLLLEQAIGTVTPLLPLGLLLLLLELELEIGMLLVENGLQRVENHGTPLRLQKAGITSRSRVCEWSGNVAHAIFAL
jgi:hypothetical protein